MLYLAAPGINLGGLYQARARSYNTVAALSGHSEPR